MVPWRRKKSASVTGAGDGAPDSPAEIVIPTHFRCPISLDMMKDPVTMSTGITYDRESIEKWLEAGNMTCPMTKQVLRTLDPVPNHTIRRMIQDWCVENRSHGVERIPTPRIPISPNEVGQILGRISVAHEAQECREFVGKLNKAMKESERNRKCIVANGSGRILASTFETFAGREGEGVISVLGDVMTVLSSMLPLNEDAIVSLKSTGSLERIVWFLNDGGLSERRNAVVILKEVVSSLKNKEEIVQKLVEIQGVKEGLIKLIKEPICPASTKASLVVIYHMITSPSPAGQTIIPMLVEMGLVSLLLETLVDAEKGICEKALGVLDGLCRAQVGREVAQSHALTVPVVVKKILRVSELATDFSVSALWRLSQGEGIEKGGNIVVVEEALQVGWNINGRTKEKVTRLLKLLHGYRGRGECIESVDLQDLKRPF
ncbi:hypothetical protein Cgig2_004283 [Carnegiea gigantea]|uniref:U-box domain-containing protein n=1 Tax=Carnegiea gigantea TaxID=171969 RepID=A0A9Q1KGS5_9CARY|nr:hypothetical protein Cgig2_004283 [Carnegiea gigantea]